MLIDEIIELLSNEQSSLSEALLKTKVLLHTIGKKELSEWVNHELNGYPDDVEIPEYRVLQSKVLANISNGAWRYEAHPIPIAHLKPDRRAHLEAAHLRQSLSILETFDTGKKGGFLTRDIPMEGNAKLEESLTGGYHIERAWCQTPVHDIKGVLTQVRSRLLDFILELKQTVGDSKDEESIKRKADAADATSMFNNAIFGPNATVLVGNHNSQNIRNEVIQGNFATLAQALTKAGLPSDEIESLKAAVLEDESGGQTTPFEGKTGTWFINLLGRAAKGGLKIGTDVASKVATDALTAYFRAGAS
jgi:hypothetical protein